VLADRNILRPLRDHHVVAAGGDLVVRLRWRHSRLTDLVGRPFSALTWVRPLRVGQVGDWPVRFPVLDQPSIEGRVVAIRLPAPLAANATRLMRRNSQRTQQHLTKRSLEAAHFILIFTTLSRDALDAAGVLELYRGPWQIELVFKRLKQLLTLGHVPHKHPAVARGWISAKLVASLLLETLYRNARSFSPWGYAISRNAAIRD